MLTVKNVAVSFGFIDLITALILFLTLPVTVATAERSFSKFKLIKKHLRNSMGQSRLSGLSLLAIKAAHDKSMNINELIDEFAKIVLPNEIIYSLKCNKPTTFNYFCLRISFTLSF